MANITSILFDSIMHIIKMGSQEQMVWVIAWRIVTMMTYTHSFWDFSMMKNPRISMSSPISIVNDYSAIIGSVPQTSPNPASIWMRFERDIFKEVFWPTNSMGMLAFSRTIFSATISVVIRQYIKIFLAIQALLDHIHLSSDLMKEQTESVRLLIIRAAGTRFANGLLHARQAEAI